MSNNPQVQRVSPNDAATTDGLSKINYEKLEFRSKYVVMLHGYDFNLNSPEIITLGKDYLDCFLVLFYVENQESYDLSILWSRVASRVTGPQFAAINMVEEKQVAQGFSKIIANPNHPLHWAGLRQYPTILVYRQGYPVAAYNGPRTTQSLTDYAMDMACNPHYRETVQLGYSMALRPEDQLGIPGMTLTKQVESSNQLNAPLREYGKNVSNTAAPQRQNVQETPKAEGNLRQEKKETTPTAAK
jgi:hypothetical protein